MSPIETEAVRILIRLKKMDRAQPRVDKPAVETALHDHFRAVGVECPPLRWMEDLTSALNEVDGRNWNREWLIEEAAAWSAARTALRCDHDPGWESGETPMLPKLRREVGLAAWRPEDTRVRELSQAGWLSRLDGGRILGSSWRPGGRGATLAARLMGDGGAENRATRFEKWRPPPFNDLTAAGATEEAVAWISAAERNKPTDAPVKRMVDIWRPFLAAFEAGLWVYLLLNDEMLLVPRPAVRMRNGRLHADNGPAISWPDGQKFWFWNGVEVPQRIVEDPVSITTQDILSQSNVEIRRVLLERYGLRKFLLDVKATPIHSDDFGALYRVEIPDDEPLVMVKVVNSTPEPDGSSKEYFLRVPPELTTAHAAVAWTFGLRPQDYHPRLET